MADNLTNTAENRGLDWLLGGEPTGPVGDLTVALVTELGDDASAGTEVDGGDYERRTLAAGAASGGSTSNSGDLMWSGMPAVTVTGVEVWDSAGTPVRWWWGALDDPKELAAGDEFKLPAGALTFSLA